jgi:hypothetical protein
MMYDMMTSILQKIELFYKSDNERVQFTYFTFVEGMLIQADTSFFNVLRHIDFWGESIDRLDVYCYSSEPNELRVKLIASLTHEFVEEWELS